jgi:hypothetical protein
LSADVIDGSIGSSKLNLTSVSSLLVPTGAVMTFPSIIAPTGWLALSGQTLSRSTYSNLWTFAQSSGNIVTDAQWTSLSAYGAFTTGDLSTTFRIPDLRGHFVRGSGTHTDGTTAGTFGVKVADSLQNITGKLGVVGNQPAAGFGGSSVGALYSSDFANSGGAGGGGTAGNSGYINFDASKVARTSTETRPKNIALLYCIKT